MEIHIFAFLFFVIPIATIIWFVVSLVAFNNCPKESVEERKNKKALLIASSIVSGLIIAAYLFLIISFSVTLTHM